MPKEFSRSARVTEQIKRELAELLRLEVKDPRVKMVSLTDVEITPDYAHAKIYFTSLEGIASEERILAGLQAASGFLRRELGRRIRIHTTPQLHFVYDKSLEDGARLSSLIEQAVRSDSSSSESSE